MPTLSIITPSFGQLDWLRLCVRSVREQVGQQWESGNVERSESDHLPALPLSNLPTELFAIEHLIQDAGTPGIEEFAREIGADFYSDGALIFAAPNEHDETGNLRPATGSPETRHPSPATRHYRIAIYRESDAGMYDAINRGLKKSSGDLCAYLNCDEQYLPGALRAVAEKFAAEADTEIVFADAVVVDEHGNYICHRKAQVPFRDQLWFRMPILTCATFFRRRVFGERGVWFDETKKVLGDVIWVMRAQKAGARMATLRRFTSIFTEMTGALGVGQKADDEFLALQRAMPGHVRKLLPFYLLYHRVRTAASGILRQAPFDYALFTADSPTRRVTRHVDKPTAIWHTRLEVDKKALAAEREK